MAEELANVGHMLAEKSKTKELEEEDCVDCSEPMTVNINVTLAQLQDSATEGYDEPYNWGMEPSNEDWDDFPTGLDINGDEETNTSISKYDFPRPEINYRAINYNDDENFEEDYLDELTDEVFNNLYALTNWDLD